LRAAETRSAVFCLRARFFLARFARCANPHHLNHINNTTFNTNNSARVSTTNNGATAAAGDTAALPVVKIDNRSDAFATIVTVEFGDRLGELLDTVRPRVARCDVLL
jgi:hypothetical protein